MGENWNEKKGLNKQLDFKTKCIYDNFYKSGYVLQGVSWVIALRRGPKMA